MYSGIVKGGDDDDDDDDEKYIRQAEKMTLPSLRTPLRRTLTRSRAKCSIAVKLYVSRLYSDETKMNA